ncbi:Uma2 family endonuclease [Roseofilum capinflatum]|uniref:Uma2 family endonuclease n=1 Tax=Roseofilum capinflatum BLCC-M114 TaxID=3022440 RepID=A0ABT7BDS0_9CYAN|nr:Uma2 family endonuclease [Roseofilum capinflatum]MDJ1176734.1 Uma2 family endonuclease [Roseofilum capinflatum BLCC-M114]
MVQARPQLTTFQDFLTWKPETGRYELHDGVIFEMQPTGFHEQVVGVINRKVNVWLDRQNLAYFIPNTAMIQPLGFESGYKPDLMVVDPAELSHEPLWERESVITLGSSLKLVVEVVSTNWPDDYARKFEDYEAMGIPEYWIVDPLGLGGHRYIGKPKQPTITVCHWVDGVYDTQLFRRGDEVISKHLLGLQFSVSQFLPNSL